MINRRASGSWTGDVQTGAGSFSTQSGALKDLPFTLGSRFGDVPGSNPEELIAAAQAGCYSMALTAYLASQNIVSKRIDTKTICTLEPLDGGGFKIAKMHITATGDVPGIDNARFQQLAAEAEKKCPVANALRGNVEIVLEANLAASS